ncbi:hypothetical protein TA5114_02345 [Cognatishimia activa]|uniref:Uncharacterized protein n=2 Tax=Cognatishimia activa TaxID=1715691 RepID=A0A0P1IZN4_9RHOB|nr:hypothetical protein TA5113_01172 [Cognatishimia activa]CUK26530.1 hypothetical protein TA5114_02345 [Cognatishimia activa]
MFGGGQTKCAAMADPRDEFSLRLRRLNAQRKKDLKRSRSAFIDNDGYVIVRGYREKRGIPYTGIMILVVGFFGLKGAMMAQMGEATYAAKVDELRASDSSVAQVGVWTLTPDPVSNLVATHLRDYL